MTSWTNFWAILGYHMQFGPATVQIAAAKSLSVLEWSHFTNWRSWSVSPMTAANRGHSVNKKAKMSKYRFITDTYVLSLKIPLYLQNVFFCPSVPLSCWRPKSTLAFVAFFILLRILNLIWTARSHFDHISTIFAWFSKETCSYSHHPVRLSLTASYFWPNFSETISQIAWSFVGINKHP